MDPNLQASSAGSEQEKGQRKERETAKQRRQQERKQRKIVVSTLNVDGMWDDQRRQDILKALAVEQTSGGILLLQDLRLTEVEIKTRWKEWWRGLAKVEENDLTMRFTVKEGLHNAKEEHMKRMGGVLGGTWGVLLERTRIDKSTKDDLARWSITEIRGKGKACISCFSTYRSFRGSTAQAGEGLVVRECRAHGWEVNPTNLARTEKAYFDDLGAAITQKLTAGHAVIVGGDINIDRKREKEFREWLTEVGMVDTGAEDKLDTFRHASGSGSRLDFILLSQDLNNLRKTKPEVRTVGHTEHWGHRAVTLDLTDPITQFLGLRQSELNWKEHRARARKLAQQQQPPPRIDQNRKEEYKKRVEARVQADGDLQAYIRTVQAVSQWG